MTTRARKKHPLIAGVRHAGEPEFQFKIFGNPASQFPPLLLKMSLVELQQWLRHLNDTPPEALRERPARLRPVG